MSFDAALRETVLGYVVCLAGHGNFYSLRMIPAMPHDRTVLSCQVRKELFGATGPSLQCLAGSGCCSDLTVSGILTVSISEA